MGVFVIANRKVSVEQEELMRIAARMGIGKALRHDLNDYVVWSWNKHLLNEAHQLVRDGAALFVAGTPVYKGAINFSDSIEKMFDDLINRRWDYRNIRGSYCLCFSVNGERPTFYTDQAGIGNLYFDKKEEFISTSFLMSLYGLKRNVSLNRNAAIEVSTNGRLIGPDTLVNEVDRAELHFHSEIHGLSLVSDQELLGIPAPIRNSFDGAVDEQIQTVTEYFDDIAAFAKHYKVDSGITGGHDSRMNLMFLLRHIGKENFQLHSFWRKTKDIELSTAEKVSKAAGMDLLSIPVKHHHDMTADEMALNLEEAMTFYDGHVRMHCFYTEMYNTKAHRIEILRDKRVGINGIGGEQYRNDCHMESSSWSMEYFIRYFLCYHVGGKNFTDSKEEEAYLKWLDKKVRTRLKIPADASRISKIKVQEYMNEVYVSSLMGARTNAEQKLAHFLTPFIDRQLTRASYKALKHFGISFAFQQAMLRKMNPELAAVTSGYGYDFLSGEPLKVKIMYLIKELVPKEIYQSRTDKKVQSRGNADFRDLVSKYPAIAEAVATLRKFKLPLQEDNLTSRPDIMPVYVSLAYFVDSLSRAGKLMA